MNDLLYLITELKSENELGDVITIDTEKQVFCKRKSIRQSEHYQAFANGLKPEIAFDIHSFEYSGEQKLKYKDKYYNVIRTYERTDEITEVICEGVVNNGNA